MRDTLAPDAPYIHWKHLLAKLDESVKAYCSAKVVSIEDNGVRITDASGKELLLPADNVLIATGMRATGPRYDGWVSLVDNIRCLTMMLSGTPMRICGRISKNGMKRSKAVSQGAHFLLYEHGEIQNVDSCLEHTLQTMGPGGLFVTGANAPDAFGHAALLIGSPGGGGYGTCMPFLYIPPLWNRRSGRRRSAQTSSL